MFLFCCPAAEFLADIHGNLGGVCLHFIIIINGVMETEGREHLTLLRSC